MASIKNAIGLKFYNLTVLDAKRENRKTYYYCKCDCGNKKWMRADHIKNGVSKSCGCLTRLKPKDISGMKFGRLTAIEITEQKRDNGSIFWKCKCECGNTTLATVTDLKLGRVISCGCFKKEYQLKQGDNIGNKFIEKFIIQDTNLQVIGTDKVNSRNTSGYKGVQWCSGKNRWLAIIKFQKRTYHLGYYKEKEDAIKARKEAEEKFHKNFIRELETAEIVKKSLYNV